MFLFNRFIPVWAIFVMGLGVFAGLTAGYFYWVNVQQGIGREGEKLKWEKVVAEQKIEAADMLAKETAEVVAVKEALQEVKNKREIQDAKNTKIVAGLTSQLHALGRLRDPKAGHRDGSDSTESNSASSSSDCGDYGAETNGLLSTATSDDLRQLVLEADIINLAYTSCRENSSEIRELINAR